MDQIENISCNGNVVDPNKVDLVTYHNIFDRLSDYINLLQSCVECIKIPALKWSMHYILCNDVSPFQSLLQSFIIYQEHKDDIDKDIMKSGTIPLLCNPKELTPEIIKSKCSEFLNSTKNYWDSINDTMIDNAFISSIRDSIIDNIIRYISFKLDLNKNENI